jgi:hypothetical protein
MGTLLEIKELEQGRIKTKAESKQSSNNFFWTCPNPAVLSGRLLRLLKKSGA